jgi:hypothetical protein
MIPADANASGLICVYRLDGRGGAVDLIDAGAAERLRLDGGILWLHFEQRHQGTERWLHQDSGLDAVTADAMLGVNPRPRTLIRDNAALISLRGISVDPEVPGITLSFQLWSDGRRMHDPKSGSWRPPQAVSDPRICTRRALAPAMPGPVSTAGGAIRGH